MPTHFATLADFFAMGGHGFYVWLAYGTAALVFTVLLLEPAWRRRQLKQQLAAHYRRERLDAQERGTPRNQPPVTTVVEGE